MTTLSLGLLSAAGWPGGVSARGVALSTSAVLAGLDRYYVSIDPLAKTRCIDGHRDNSEHGDGVGCGAIDGLHSS